MLSAFILLVAPPATVDDACDLIEVNRFYDENGKLVFDQVIFWDWKPIEGEYHVAAWRLLKSEEQKPYRSPVCDCWETVWHDGDVLRRVRAPYVRETWTQFDPELANREMLKKEFRRDLWKPKAVETKSP